MNTAISAGDTAWVLTSTALVMVMTVGLAFFYGGLVRPKNSLNTMMMSVVALGVVSVQWVLVGYSIAFAHGTPWWGGLSWVAFKGVGLDPDPAYAATIPLQARKGRGILRPEIRARKRDHLEQRLARRRHVAQALDADLQ